MTVTASTGAFGWARQSAKGTAVSPEYWHRAHQVDLGEVESRVLMDPEVGGSILPSGLIKTGVHAAGGVLISPRLESTLGYLIFALMGSCTTSSDHPESGAHEHQFKFATDEAAIDWMTLYKLQPGSSQAEDTGLRVTDAKVAAARIMLPVRDRVRMRLDFVGIKPEVIADPKTNASPVWNPSFEEETSVPITTKPSGGFEWPDGTAVSLAQGCVIDITNGLSDPMRQEAVIGSYYPDDVAVLGRAAIIRFPTKIDNYDNWTNAVFSQSDASALSTWTEWDPVTYSSTFEVTCESPGNISGLSTPYKIKIYAGEVHWTVDPITMVGAQMMIANVTGTVMKPASLDPLRISITNEVASYAWT